MQKFPSMLSSILPLQDDEEDVSYDAESLFTNIPIKETISYITEQIYVHKKFSRISSKMIFRRFLIKLATICTFKFNFRFLKQVDGCTMGGPLSVTFSDIYMVKMENDVEIPSKPIFNRRFADDICSRWKLGDNVLFERLNSYHPNIKLTIVNPSKFLDTKLTNISGTYKFSVYWKNYLHRGPPKLLNATSKTQSMVIFIVEKEYHNVAMNDNNAENVEIYDPFFPLKDKNNYKSCVIYKGDCSCGSRYIGETKGNAKVRWNEHNNLTKSSDPSKHIRNNINHYYTWAVISNAPKNA